MSCQSESESWQHRRFATACCTPTRSRFDPSIFTSSDEGLHSSPLHIIVFRGCQAGWSEDEPLLLDSIQPLLTHTKHFTQERADDIAELIRFMVSASFASQERAPLTPDGYNLVTRETPHPNPPARPRTACVRDIILSVQGAIPAQERQLIMSHQVFGLLVFRFHNTVAFGLANGQGAFSGLCERWCTGGAAGCYRQFVPKGAQQSELLVLYRGRHTRSTRVTEAHGIE